MYVIICIHVLYERFQTCFKSHRMAADAQTFSDFPMFGGMNLEINIPNVMQQPMNSSANPSQIQKTKRPPKTVTISGCPMLSPKF